MPGKLRSDIVKNRNIIANLALEVVCNTALTSHSSVNGIEEEERVWVQVVEQQVQGEAVPQLAEACLTDSGLAHPNIILTHKILSRTRTVSHSYMHTCTYTAALWTSVDPGWHACVCPFLTADQHFVTHAWNLSMHAVWNADGM